MNYHRSGGVFTLHLVVQYYIVLYQCVFLFYKLVHIIIEATCCQQRLIL